jgi:hypothetical protein
VYKLALCTLTIKGALRLLDFRISAVVSTSADGALGIAFRADKWAGLAINDYAGIAVWIACEHSDRGNREN